MMFTSVNHVSNLGKQPVLPVELYLSFMMDGETGISKREVVGFDFLIMGALGFA